MRSEFLGDCAKYRGLPEAINEGQYLVPQLSRGQIKEIIEDPITIAGKKIAPGLVELLVNEIEESKVKKDLDQLPILQHTLMRTYQVAMEHHATEITYEHYVATGCLKDALANHAESRYDDLGDGSNKESFKQRIAKIIFQALTDGSTDQKKGRRPTELKVLHDIALSIKASGEEVNAVIDHFRDTETSFIMPPSNTSLYPDLMIDISHESLMRQWSRLKDWVMQESENGKMMQRLAENLRLNKSGQKDYLVGKELKLFCVWFKNFNPRNSWSKRYSPDYKESFEYLSKSIKNKDKKLLQIFVGAFAVVAIMIAAFVLITNHQKTRERLLLVSKKRTEALRDETRLQALLLTAEVLILEKNEVIKDSLIRQSIKLPLNPTYALKDVFLFPDKVMYASISPDGNSFFILKNDKSFTEVITGSGKEIRSGNYSVVKDEDVSADLIKVKYLKLFYNTPQKYTQDTVLTDSSDYFKLLYLKDNVEKDDFGIFTFPSIVKTVSGAYHRSALPVKPAWLTWGENTESIFTSVNIWNESGITAGLSLIHEGIYGAVFGNNNRLILTWGSDSAVKVWQLANDTAMMRLPAELLKKKIEVETGVELDKNDPHIKLISYPDYFKRKEKFLLDYNAYKKNNHKK
jgi:hypothetical protein